MLRVLAAVFLLPLGILLASDTATQSVTMTVSSICVVDVTGNPPTLAIVAPGTGGATPSNATDTSTYVQYTSTVATGTTRNLSAKIGAGDIIPAGCSLKLTVTPSGGTNEGSTAGQITLSSTASNIVTGIGSCATGTGGTDGAQLSYSLEVTAMTSLQAASETATVTLTLEDAA